MKKESFEELRKKYLKNSKEYGRDAWIAKWQQFPGCPDFRLVTHLSGMWYEKQQCESAIAFTSQKLDEKNYVLKFKNPIKFDEINLRNIRKSLQMVDKNHCLIIQKRYDGFKAVGIYPLDIIDPQFVFMVEITEHMNWCAKIAGNFLFEYRNGEYVVVDHYDIDWIFLKAKKCFANLFSDLFEKKGKKIELDWLKIVLHEIKNTKHGSTIVIHENAKEEVERLTPPEVGHGNELDVPKNLSGVNREYIKSFITQATKIDGGLLMDPFGKCLAFGSIFDGLVPLDEYKCGRADRGSRYNSVRLYVYNQRKNQKNCMAVVFSDDLSIDII